MVAGREFDRTARNVTEPEPEFVAAVAAVAATADEEVLTALLDELDTLCSDEDETAARHYADHLAALGALLPRIRDGWYSPEWI